MSTSVENQVVRVRLENDKFEAGVKKSLRSAEQLEKGLKFEGVGKGLEELETRTRGITKSLGDGENAVNHFSIWAIAKFKLVSDTVGQLENATKSLIKSLTVDNISAGWNKYAEQTSSIQTIMAATGKSIDEVTEQMDKLSWFTDETSYNLVDMTSNIGKFTSNGIELEKAVTAMIGIADAAGLAGAGTQKASHAMEGFSKAIAEGKFNRQNWTWIETAGLATKQFKDTAIEAGLALGTLQKRGDQYYATAKGFEKATKFTYQTFEQSLTDAWFTSDVILKTLEQFGGFTEKLYEATDRTGITASELLGYIEQYKAGTLDIESVAREAAMSTDELSAMFDELGSDIYAVGEKSLRASQEAKTFAEALDSVKDAVSSQWSKTWEIIFGNYEEARHLWTTVANELYDIFASGGETRNALLEEWKELGGRTDLLEGLVRMYVNLKTVLDSVKAAYRSVFPELTSDRLYAMTAKFKEITKQFTLTDRQAEQLRRTAKGLFSVLELGVTTLKKLASGLTSLVGGVLDEIDVDFLEIAASAGDALVSFTSWVKQCDILDSVMSGIGTGIRAVILVVKLLVSELVRLANSNGVIGAFFRFMSTVFKESVKLGGGIVDAIKEMVNNLSALDHITLQDVNNEIKKFFAAFTAGKNSIGQFFNSTKKSFYDFIDQAAVKIKEFIDKIPFVESALLKLVSSIKEVLDNFDFGSLMVIALSASMIKVFHVISEFIKGLSVFVKPLEKVLKSIKGIAGSISGVFDQVGKILKTYQNYINSKRLINIAIAIGILAGSIALLCNTCDPAELWEITKVLGVVAAGLVAMIAALNMIEVGRLKKNMGNLQTIALSIISASGAISLMTVSLKILESIDWEGKTLKIIGGMTLIVGGLAALMLAAAKSSPVILAGSGAILAMSAACILMAQAFKSLSKLETSNAMKGVIGIAAVVASVIALSKLSGKVDAKSMLSLIPAALAMVLFATTVKAIELIKPAKVISGIGSMIVIVGLMSVLMVAASKSSKYTAKAGAAILAMSAALLILVPAIKSLSKLKPENLTKAVTAIGAITILYTAFVGISKLGGKDSGKAGLAILSMSVALGVISVAIAGLSIIKPEKLSTATQTIVLIMGMMALIVKASRNANDAKATLIAVGASMASLALILASMTLLDPEKAKLGTSVVMALSACLAAIVGMSKFVKKVDWTLAILVGSIGLLSYIVYKLGSSDMNPERAIGATKSIGVLIGELIAMSILTTALAAVPVSAVLSGMKVVGTILGAVSLVVVAISGISDAIDMITKESGSLSNFINKGAEVLTSLGAAIGGFFGGIVGGAVSAFNDVSSSNLDTVANRLSNFMINLEPFFQKAQEFASIADGKTKSGFDNAISIVDMIDKLISIGVTPIQEGSLQNIGGQLVSFSFQLTSFSKIMSNFNSEIIPVTEEAADMIRYLAASAPRFGGAQGLIFGNIDLAKLGSQLLSFGSGLVGYSGWMMLFKNEAVENSNSAVKMLISIFENVPKFNSIFDKVFGVMDMAALKQQLWDFAIGLVGYSNWISLFKTESVESSMSAIKTLVNLASNSPKFSGIEQAFGGKIDMARIGDQMRRFAISMVQYSDTITGGDGGNGFNAEAVSRTTDAIQALILLTKFLPESLSLWQKIFGGGKVNISEFGNQINELGYDISSYSESIIDVDPVKMQEVTTQLSGLITQLTRLKDFDYASVSNFSMSLYQVGEAIGHDFPQGYVDGMSSVKDLVYETATSIGDLSVDGLRTSIDSHSPSRITYRIGVDFDNGFINGIRSKYDGVKQVATGVGTWALNALRVAIDSHSPSQKTNTEGKNFDQGLINGMEAKIGQIWNQAKRVGEIAVSGVVSGLRAKMSEVKGGFISNIESSVSDIMSTLMAPISEATESAVTTASEAMETGGYDAGSGFSSSAGKGISSNKSPEEAAQSKAEAINNVFQDTLSKLDLSKSIRDKEFALWEQTEGYGADEATVQQRKLEDLTKEVKEAQKRVDAAKKNHEDTARELGESSEETTEAYGKLLDEQTNLAKLINEISELQKEMNSTQTQTMASQREAYQAYYDYLKNYKDNLLAMGLSLEEVQKLARKEAGLPEPTVAASSVTGEFNKIASATSEITKTVESTASSMHDYGLAGTYNLGSGIQDGMDDVVDTINDMNKANEDAISSQNETWGDLGNTLVGCFVDGIQEKVQVAAEAAATMAKTAYNSAMEAISSSTSSGPVPVTISGGGGGSLGKSQQYTIDYNGSPIKVGQSAYLAYMANKNTSTTSTSKSGGAIASSITNNTFNQTINSPKAISSSTVYRQTKNAFSSFSTKVASSSIYK